MLPRGSALRLVAKCEAPVARTTAKEVPGGGLIARWPREFFQACGRRTALGLRRTRLVEHPQVDARRVAARHANQRGDCQVKTAGVRSRISATTSAGTFAQPSSAEKCCVNSALRRSCASPLTMHRRQSSSSSTSPSRMAAASYLSVSVRPHSTQGVASSRALPVRSGSRAGGAPLWLSSCVDGCPGLVNVNQWTVDSQLPKLPAKGTLLWEWKQAGCTRSTVHVPCI